MQSTILFSWLAVFILATLVVGGNYLVNRRQGMRDKENLKETRMWGAGFIVYAVLDYFILIL